MTAGFNSLGELVITSKNATDTITVGGKQPLGRWFWPQEQHFPADYPSFYLSQCCQRL